MGAFARSSSSVLFALGVGVGLLAAAGCTDELAPIEGVQSLRVVVTSPADLHSEADPIDDEDNVTELIATIEALDAENEVAVDFEGVIDLYVHFLGGLTPEMGTFDRLARIELAAGVGEVTVPLPPVYGPTFLWAQHSDSDGDGFDDPDATYATGTSDTIWFRPPYLEDVSRPDEDALDALEDSPLAGKQINVVESRYGASGRMVVTGVYAQGYTVSDAECADATGAPPCTTGDYDHVFVFTFSRPKDEDFNSISVGETISRLTGAVQEFNGLTEVGFPQTFVEDPSVDEDRVPEPILIEEAWFDDEILFERAEAALVAIEGATLCALDEDYDTFKQWKLDLGAGCNDSINVITAGVADFDPAEHVGAVIPRVVGTLRPINIGSFNVWIVYPRGTSDVTPPAPL
jgi:hypothetical protein